MKLVVLLKTILTMFLFSETSFACVYTDTPVEHRAISLSKSCFEFVAESNPIETSKWRSSNNRFMTNKLFRYFNEYDEFTEMKSTWMCETTTYAAIGVRDENGRRICHIAYQKSDILPDSFRTKEFIENRTEIELIEVDESFEEITNDIGTTIIHKRGFCLSEEYLGKVSLISTELVPSDEKDGRNYNKWRNQQGGDIQHIFFTNDKCDPALTE